jgi:alkylhydroperoxidase family enzyme
MTAMTLSSEHGALPLDPIDRPRSLFVRVLYGATRRRYGKTPTAFRIVYARSAWIALASMVVGLVLEYGLQLHRELRLLLQLSLSTQNGCTFCSDLMYAEAMRLRIGKERFAELLDFETSTHFSAREKAALAYAQAVHESLHVRDAIWSRLAEHFSERERVEIVWVCAVERYFNSIALPLRIGSDHLTEAR